MRRSVLFLLVSGVAGCPAPPPPPSGPPSPSVSATTIVSATPSASAPSPSDAGALDPIPTKGALPAPIFSTDPCSQDGDCAPVATCHADRCVAKSNAGTLAPGTMCTQVCLAGTLDCGFNRCGCALASDGTRRCATLPGGKP